MQELKQHENFEMEVLKLLSDNKLLTPLIFGGGTCLRLCFGLDRYSVDLDFWVKKYLEKEYFRKIKKVLSAHYKTTDHKEKHFSLLTEIKSDKYLRKLKIEIRKKLPPNACTELNIAFSAYSNHQVRMTAFTLEQMFKNKSCAIMERKEIRDAYDIEFIYKKNRNTIKLLSDKEKDEIVKILDSFKPKDFKIKLGSLLDAEERKYYNQNGFRILKNALL